MHFQFWHLWCIICANVFSGFGVLEEFGPLRCETCQINCLTLTMAPLSWGEPVAICICRTAGLKSTRTPTQSGEAASPPDVAHLQEQEHVKRAALTRLSQEGLYCRYRLADRRCSLTCAFIQSCLEALQETVEEQFPSGQTGGRSRRTLALSPLTGRVRWITAETTEVEECLWHGYTLFSMAQTRKSSTAPFK